MAGPTETEEPAPLAAVEEALSELAAGRPVLLVGEGEAGSEVDLLLAARLATPTAVDLMAREAGGAVELALSWERCAQLGLEPGCREGSAEGAVAVSVEARDGVGSGASARDRARTIQVAIDPSSGPGDLVRPGHVFPVASKPGGVLERPGRAEAAVDLVRLAGLGSAAVLCRSTGRDGSLATAVEPGARLGPKAVRVAAVVAHRRRDERTVERIVSTALPTGFGDFEAVGYRSSPDHGQHLALVKGEVSGAEGVLVHVHAECRLGDVFRSEHCECGTRLEAALEAIAREGRGVVVYVGGEGRGPFGDHPPQPDAEQAALADRILADLRLDPTTVRSFAAGSDLVACDVV